MRSPRLPGTTRWALAATALLVLSTLGFTALAALSAGPIDDPADADASYDDPAAGTSVDSAPVSDMAGRNLQALLTPRGWDPFTAPAIDHTPPFPLEDGRIPTKSEALDGPNTYRDLIAIGDAGLDRLAAEGHFTGAGTTDDPYVLEDFYVDRDLKIQSTDRALILRDGWVDGQLSLNYIGDEVYVHHVHAQDLRINENVARSGANTGGLFEHNTFAFVGQIRHFIGEYRDNTIGPKPSDAVASYLSDTGEATVPDEVVFNFDGFHGADVHDNLFKGRVDIKLHGHNHADCFLCPTHDHTDLEDHDADETADTAEESPDHSHGTEDPALDALGFHSRHSVRYHSLLFRDNTIQVPGGTALRYHDRAHAGDDQTANSEPNTHLEDPHIHYQDITLRGNRLDGGRLHLDVFNARDDRHVVQNQGILRIVDNHVTIHHPEDARGTYTGIRLAHADGMELLAEGNTVRFQAQKDDSPAGRLLGATHDGPTLIGFALDRFDATNATLAGNTVTTGTYGVYATEVRGDVYWELLGNDFRTEMDYQGDDVATAPHRDDDPEASRRRGDDT